MTIEQAPSWTAHTESCTDSMDWCHAARVALALDAPQPEVLEDLPPLWHWAFFTHAEPYARLGRDGHAVHGGFSRAVAGCNRMWAGSRVDIYKPLVIGRPAQRDSKVLDVKEKTGHSGKFLLVTLGHVYSQDGRRCVAEEQDIVYREAGPPVLVGTKPAPQAEWGETITPDTRRLFRYSAVTYNTHRIHYDADYARDVEGYPGLVVHGPLIATLMLEACQRAHPGRAVRRFSYRALRPLFAPAPFQVGGIDTGVDTATLWAEQDSTLAHQASVEFFPL